MVDALPRPGETVLAASLTRTPGGKGANQAVAAARAGAQVQFSGAFGDDPAAAQLRAHLRANAVGLDRTVTVPGPSGTAIIVVDASAENTVLVAPGANAHLTPVPSAVANCDVLLTQLEIPVATALAAARAAQSADAVVMVNASPAGQDRSSLQDLAAIADVVIANEHEANDWPSPPTHFVITLGVRGARYVGADGVFEVPAPTVTPVDTAGAATYLPGSLLRIGRATQVRRPSDCAHCGGPALRVRWQLWCPVPATAHRPPPRSMRPCEPTATTVHDHCYAPKETR